jgi:integrase
VYEQLPSGPRLFAFFAVTYYAALRPEEAVNLRRDNNTLPHLAQSAATGEWEEPGDNSGELRFCLAAPEVGAEWTDDGARREQRHLKSRPVGEWRLVPVAPPLTRLVRAYLQTFGTGPGDRLFSGVYGDELASITYRRTWDKARREAMTPGEYASPLAKRVTTFGTRLDMAKRGCPGHPPSPTGPGMASPSCSRSTPNASTARTR